MEYLNALELDRSLADILSPDKFITEMKDIGILLKPTTSYCKDVRGLERYATTWIVGQLKRWGLDSHAQVVEGYYRGKPTCWVEFAGYYFDLTLAQFVENAPQLSIVKKEEGLKPQHYSVGSLSTVQDWVKELDERTSPFANLITEIKNLASRRLAF